MGSGAQFCVGTVTVGPVVVRFAGAMADADDLALLMPRSVAGRRLSTVAFDASSLKAFQAMKPGTPVRRPDEPPAPPRARDWCPHAVPGRSQAAR